jgi:hypothetical protein
MRHLRRKLKGGLGELVVAVVVIGALVAIVWGLYLLTQRPSGNDIDTNDRAAVVSATSGSVWAVALGGRR